MRAEQAVALLRATLAGLGVADTAEAEAEAEAEEMIARVANLTPGDFAAAARRVRALGAPVTAVGFAAEVVAEVRVKEGVAARIGF
jgi:hypothetical protein